MNRIGRASEGPGSGPRKPREFVVRRIRNSGVIRSHEKFVLRRLSYVGSKTVKDGPTFRTTTQRRTASSAMTSPSRRPLHSASNFFHIRVGTTWEAPFVGMKAASWAMLIVMSSANVLPVCTVCRRAGEGRQDPVQDSVSRADEALGGDDEPILIQHVASTGGRV